MRFGQVVCIFLFGWPWIIQGDGTASIRQADRTWAFREPSRAEPPSISDPAWVRTPIDRFVLAKLEAAGLKPLPPASRATLIRRLTFDVTGLPPLPHEIAAFENDPAPDAYEQLIDRLLSSPAYGERWAQHWLDIARFAETDGFEHDLVRPNAWRYRDWVIDSLNADISYDQFIRFQLAGDEVANLTELPPVGRGAAVQQPNVATGFLLCGPDMPDINLQEERRHNVLNEMTATVGSVFLGLQLGCAQCHDHKFDPIPTADFYRLRAFFEPAEFFDEAPIATPAQIAERERLEAPIKAEREKLELELKKYDVAAHERLNKDPQVKISRDELLAALSETERQQFQKLNDDLKQLAGRLPALPVGRVLREKGGTPRPSHIMLRGDFRTPGPRITPAFPAIANPQNSAVEVSETVSPSSGRRTALAQWLTAPGNPLTARVMVNRVWQLHFGQGLVRTPSDFGKMGDAPSHPELLDWLATEFMRPAAEGGCGWSLKRLHKLMLASAVYMQASRPTEPRWAPSLQAEALERWRQSRQLDPENRLLARMNRLRLDGESIRDAMLAASDRLSPRRGGPGVRPPLPDELTNTLLKGQWTVTPDEEDHRRRSIYIFVRRNLRYPLFDVFDHPDTNASCPQRPRSTTAPQSLTLLNSELSLDEARDLAGLIWTRAGDDPARQITEAYGRVLARAPTAAELDASAKFLTAQAARLRGSRSVESLAVPRGVNNPADPYAATALIDFCLALFNLNEFVYLD